VEDSHARRERALSGLSQKKHRPPATAPADRLGAAGATRDHFAVNLEIEKVEFRSANSGSEADNNRQDFPGRPIERKAMAMQAGT